MDKQTPLLKNEKLVSTWKKVMALTIAFSAFVIAAAAFKTAIFEITGIRIPVPANILSGAAPDDEVAQVLEKADHLYFKTMDGRDSVAFYREAADKGNAYAQAVMAKILYRGMFKRDKDEQSANEYALASLEALTSRSADDPRSAYALGYLFHLGIGVAPDPDRALGLYHSASDTGFAPAQFVLGDAYFDGEIVLQDYELAFYWKLKAAEQGHRAAIEDVGLAYRFGWGVTASAQKSVGWLEKAAKLGSNKAHTHLGLIYELGELGQPELSIAENWYSELAARGDALGLSKVGALQWNRGGDKANAFESMRQAAEMGEPLARYNLARMYEDPSHFQLDSLIERDVFRAIELMRYSASDGVIVAQFVLSEWTSGELGIDYLSFEESAINAKSCAERESKFQGFCQFRFAVLNEYGFGMKRDLLQAQTYYERSLSNGVPEAGRNLSSVLEKIHGGNNSDINQLRLDALRRAIELSPDMPSLYSALGHLYKEQAIGIPGGPELSAEAFRAGAERGSSNAACNLGFCLINGLGVDRNEQEGVKWLRVAAESGLIPPLKTLINYVQENPKGQMTKDDLLLIRDKGIENLMARAESDGCVANELGQRFERGDIIERDLIEAARWYKQAALLGWTSGAYNFGRLNLDVEGENTNPIEGVRWLKTAAGQSSGPANLLLASAYLKGEVVEKDRGIAMDFFVEAAKLDTPLDSNIGRQRFPEEWLAFYEGRILSCEGELQEAL